MFDLFIGNYQRVMNTIVYAKMKNKFIPCLVTNYYFKSQVYTLVPQDDLSKEPEKRKVIKSKNVYLKIG